MNDSPIPITAVSVGGPVNVNLSQDHVAILELISTGMTQRRVAETLGLSQPTVAQRCREIFLKLGQPNTASAIRKAMELGIIGSQEARVSK